MGEDQIVNHLLGPSGGIFALGMLAGSVAMWAMNLKLVAPYVQRAHAAEMQAMQARIGSLEVRIKELEAFEARYMELLERHSSKTLHPKEGSA
jgi:hypothetical protein